MLADLPAFLLGKNAHPRCTPGHHTVPFSAEAIARYTGIPDEDEVAEECIFMVDDEDVRRPLSIRPAPLRMLSLRDSAPSPLIRCAAHASTQEAHSYCATSATGAGMVYFFLSLRSIFRACMI